MLEAALVIKGQLLGLGPIEGSGEVAVSNLESDIRNRVLDTSDDPQITKRGRAATKSRFLAPLASLGMTASPKCRPECSEGSAVDLWLGASSLYPVFLNVTFARLCSSRNVAESD